MVFPLFKYIEDRGNECFVFFLAHRSNGENMAKTGRA
jgi:hypothetical protein